MGFLARFGSTPSILKVTTPTYNMNLYTAQIYRINEQRKYAFHMPQRYGAFQVVYGCRTKTDVYPSGMYRTFTSSVNY